MIKYRFKVSIKVLVFICIALLINHNLQAQERRSVVRIVVDNKDAGTGFVYNSSKHVVTALHVVAGSSKIEVFSESTKEIISAKITKVHKESDLALLTLDSPLGLTPLKHNLTPNLEQEHTIWGYPRDVATYQGDPIRFSKSGNSNPTLKDILKTGDEILTELKNQGYPLSTVNILRVSSIIQPGHSGSPITNNNNQVVGIADGGLYGGTARINWAIHAKYLPILISDGIDNSNPEFPKTKSVQKQLYGNQNPETNVAVKKTFANNHELLHTMTVSLGEVYDKLSTKDKGDLDFYLDNNFEKNWRNYKVDVYEDVKTGATFSVPFKSTITYNIGKDWYNIKSKDIYEMIVKVEKTDSWNRAIEAKDNFVNELNNIKDWEKDPKILGSYVDEEFSFYNANMDWETHHSNESQKARMSAALNINDNNFFGTVYLTHDVQKMDNFDEYYLLPVYLQLATFPIH